MTIVTMLGWLPVLGVAAGLARVKVRRLPWIAAGVAVLAYVILIGSYAGWAAQCWDCPAGVSDSRGDATRVMAIFFGLYLALTLAGIWLGARFSNVAARFIATLREANSTFGPGRPQHKG
jgi:hypothetical protein